MKVSIDTDTLTRFVGLHKGLAVVAAFGVFSWYAAHMASGASSVVDAWWGAACAISGLGCVVSILVYAVYICDHDC